jgi:ribosome maturation factor RimP
MSQIIGDLLDVSDPIHHSYHLEVSSPGLNRPLRKPEHFQKQVGDVIEVQTMVPVIPSQKRRRFKGTLVNVSSHFISMDCEGTVFEIPFDAMKKSRLCYFESQETQK